MEQEKRRKANEQIAKFGDDVFTKQVLNRMKQYHEQSFIKVKMWLAKATVQWWSAYQAGSRKLPITTTHSYYNQCTCVIEKPLKNYNVTKLIS